MSTVDRLLEDASRLVGTSLSEFVPPDAQLHLLAAQRELLLAVAAIIEHNRHRTVRSPRRRPPGKRTRRTRRPTRVELE